MNGEEFVIIVRIKNQENLKNIGEKIRTVIDEFKFEHIDHITISIGCSIIEKDYYISIKEANNNLYKSKRNGKNRVTV